MRPKVIPAGRQFELRQTRDCKLKLDKKCIPRCMRRSNAQQTNAHHGHLMACPNYLLFVIFFFSNCQNLA